MFTKKEGTNELSISVNDKYRYITIPEKNYGKFIRKIEKKKNLYTDYSQYTKFNHITSRIYSKRIKKKNNKEYDIRGKNLLIYSESFDFKIKELDYSRNDGFFLKDYKQLDEYLLSFISNAPFYKQNSLPHKSGILLYGPPGNGKTSYIRYLYLNNILPKDTIFIWCKTLPEPEFLNELKKINALKVFIFEEITTTLQNTFRLDEFLQFCDGDQSIDNSVIVCTTNHPELLPENLTIRPSRFNKIIEFGNPDELARETILKIYFKDMFQNEMINQTKGLSLDQIKESFILTITNNLAFTDAIKSVKIHKDTVESSFNKYRKIGID